MRIKILLASLGALAALGSLPAHAANLVVNGDFQATTGGTNKQPGFNTVVDGWNISGYNFVFSDIASTAVGAYGGLNLWGLATGSANGAINSPTGGNFIAADGAYQVGPIEQTLKGLSAGTYTVSFDWAGAQQTGFDGANTEQWEVKLGEAASQSTAVYSNPSHGFGGWWHETFTFTVTSGDKVLSFLAHGTPEGVPPFSLLDNVSVQAVPEPETWALMFVGLGAVGFMRRRRGKVATV